MEIRRAQFGLTYEGTDISEDIAPYLLGASFTDHADSKSDDLQVTLEDRAGLWRGAWYPAKGATLTAQLRCENWFAAGDKIILPIGTYVIDQIEAAGPPASVCIKAASAFITTAMRGEKKTRAWQNTNLKTIATDIAQCNGMDFYYQADQSIEFGRIEQHEESDLQFLHRICRENGFNVKVAEKKIIIYQAETFDALPATKTIRRQADRVKTYRFTSKSHDVFKAAQVSYFDPSQKQEISYTFTPPDAPPCGHVLKINKRAKTMADAQRMAKAELRRKNKNEMNADIVMVGQPDLLAGVNVQVAGFGAVFDGKYAVDEAVHTVGSSGYETSVKLRKVLSY